MTIATHEFPETPVLDEAAAEAREELAANSEARVKLRQKIDKTELRLAAHDLLEGLRGVVRVAPLVSLALGVAIGVSWGRRSPRRPVRRA